MTGIKLQTVCIFCLLLFLFSCDRDKVFDAYQQIDDRGWNLNDTIKFEFEINAQEDVLYHSLIGLRNNNDYLYANIYFFVDLESPSGAHQTDTLQYILAAPDGRWLGSGVGAIKFNLFNFQKHQVMESGVYTYRIVHGMRDELLVGIEDVGLRIEKSN